MNAIAGFCSHKAVYDQEEKKWSAVLESMNQVQKRREPGKTNICLKKHCSMTGSEDICPCILAMDGSLYNAPELRKELKAMGAVFKTTKDWEVMVQAYLYFGEKFVARLNGSFAAALWDARKETLFLFRDRVGTKPLFYTRKGETLVYA